MAAKDSGSDQEKKPKQEPIIDQPRRRITVKQTKSDLESSRSEKEKLPKRFVIIQINHPNLIRFLEDELQSDQIRNRRKKQ